MKLSNTVVAACRMSLFFEDKLDETVGTVRLMTLFMYSHSGRVNCDITCSACTFTLLLESFRHGMNLSKICQQNKHFHQLLALYFTSTEHWGRPSDRKEFNGKYWWDWWRVKEAGEDQEPHGQTTSRHGQGKGDIGGNGGG